MAAASECTDWRWAWKLSDIDRRAREDERRWGRGCAFDDNQSSGDHTQARVLAMVSSPSRTFLRSFNTEITEPEPDFLSVLRLLRG